MKNLQFSHIYVVGDATVTISINQVKTVYGRYILWPSEV